MDWIIKEKKFKKDKTEFFGSKFCIGNGYFGYRGTLEEYGKDQLVACTVSELFDDNGSGWREPVNVPNSLHTISFYNGKEMSVFTGDIQEHEQWLELDSGLHGRKTVFKDEEGNQIIVSAERFACMSDIHALIMHYTIETDKPSELEIHTGIDCDIWDINGPHFSETEVKSVEGTTGVVCRTKESGKNVAVAQRLSVIGGVAECSSDGLMIKIKSNHLVQNRLEIFKYTAICKDSDCTDVWDSAVSCCGRMETIGWSSLFEKQKEYWNTRYRNLGIRIKGDDEAQQAIYYSCYLLYIAAPFHTDCVAIPARGLSGQVYKGAMFWDTEIYMLPVFAFCEPQTARNLMMYRVKNLTGAKEKACEYGYKGAFYPWESQETGKDGCTHYNLTDIFTGRKVRTYFRDKQIHISADVVYGLYRYMNVTKDYEILIEGAAEVIFECARFFCSYTYYKPEKDRYEFLDVTGADEYHERVNNDAYTNYMIRLTLQTALETAEYMSEYYPAQYAELEERLQLVDNLKKIRKLYEKIYVPIPDERGLIEQYDGYFREEDISIKELYSRIIKPNEYLGSPCGLAVNTQIIKQADVILLLSLLGGEFSEEVKEKNWEYYEPRTEHGSSLSTCIYALLAAQIGKTEWAYKYLMKAAKIDLEGDYKLYLGDLYIGGTHPAANGGTWQVTVQGFGGLRESGEGVRIEPHLPKRWEELEYSFCYAGGKYRTLISKDGISVTADEKNKTALQVQNYNCSCFCAPGETILIKEQKGVNKK